MRGQLASLPVLADHPPAGIAPADCSHGLCGHDGGRSFCNIGLQRALPNSVICRRAGNSVTHTAVMNAAKHGAWICGAAQLCCSCCSRRWRLLAACSREFKSGMQPGRQAQQQHLPAEATAAAVYSVAESSAASNGAELQRLPDAAKISVGQSIARPYAACMYVGAPWAMGQAALTLPQV
jgi:hypothetical protein